MSQNSSQITRDSQTKRDPSLRSSLQASMINNPSQNNPRISQLSDRINPAHLSQQLTAQKKVQSFASNRSQSQNNLLGSLPSVPSQIINQKNQSLGSMDNIDDNPPLLSQQAGYYYIPQFDHRNQQNIPIQQTHQEHIEDNPVKTLLQKGLSNSQNVKRQIIHEAFKLEEKDASVNCNNLKQKEQNNQKNEQNQQEWLLTQQMNDYNNRQNLNNKNIQIKQQEYNDWLLTQHNNQEQFKNNQNNEPNQAFIQKFSSDQKQIEMAMRMRSIQKRQIQMLYKQYQRQRLQFQNRQRISYDSKHTHQQQDEQWLLTQKQLIYQQPNRSTTNQIQQKRQYMDIEKLNTQIYQPKNSQKQISQYNNNLNQPIANNNSDYNQGVNSQKDYKIVVTQTDNYLQSSVRKQNNIYANQKSQNLEQKNQSLKEYQINLHQNQQQKKESNNSNQEKINLQKYQNNNQFYKKQLALQQIQQNIKQEQNQNNQQLIINKQISEYHFKKISQSQHNSNFDIFNHSALQEKIKKQQIKQSNLSIQINGDSIKQNYSYNKRQTVNSHTQPDNQLNQSTIYAKSQILPFIDRNSPLKKIQVIQQNQFSHDAQVQTSQILYQQQIHQFQIDPILALQNIYTENISKTVAHQQFVHILSKHVDLILLIPKTEKGQQILSNGYLLTIFIQLYSYRQQQEQNSVLLQQYLCSKLGQHIKNNKQQYKKFTNRIYMKARNSVSKYQAQINKQQKQDIHRNQINKDKQQINKQIKQEQNTSNHKSNIANQDQKQNKQYISSIKKIQLTSQTQKPIKRKKKQSQIQILGRFKQSQKLGSAFKYCLLKDNHTQTKKILYQRISKRINQRKIRQQQQKKNRKSQYLDPNQDFHKNKLYNSSQKQNNTLPSQTRQRSYKRKQSKKKNTQANKTKSKYRFSIHHLNDKLQEENKVLDVQYIKQHLKQIKGQESIPQIYFRQLTKDDEIITKLLKQADSVQQKDEDYNDNNYHNSQQTASVIQNRNIPRQNKTIQSKQKQAQIKSKYEESIKKQQQRKKRRSQFIKNANSYKVQFPILIHRVVEPDINNNGLYALLELSKITQHLAKAKYVLTSISNLNTANKNNQKTIRQTLQFAKSVVEPKQRDNIGYTTLTKQIMMMIQQQKEKRKKNRYNEN